MKIRIIIIAIISLIFTMYSPYVFSAYVETLPTDLNQTFKFGGPIPFKEQIVHLPKNNKDYPLEINYQKEEHSEMLINEFLFSLLINFILLFSVISVFLYYISKGTNRDHK